MAPPDRRRSLRPRSLRLRLPRVRPLGLLVAVSMGALAAQLVLGRDLGPLGLVVLLVPGFAIVEALRNGPLPWADRLLAGLTAAVVIAMAAGIGTALAPRGLDASSVAVVELGALVAAVLVPGFRRRRSAVEPEAAPVARPAHAHPAPAHPAPGARPERARVLRPASLAFVVLGLVLGGAGFAVATRAEATQDFGAFVQFWSLPSSPGHAALVGVRNATGESLTCVIAIDRPGQEGAVTNVPTLADGQTFSASLPSGQASEVAPWQLILHCTGTDGQAFDRQLAIDPPR